MNENMKDDIICLFGGLDLTINNSNVYVVSDIHNDADGFKELLNVINFSKDDCLIINGDIFDRGDKPVELYFEILKHNNIYVIQGNHDVWVAREILKKYADRNVGKYISYNTVSIMEQRMTHVDMINLAEWIESKPFFINLDLNGIKYQIAHAQTYLTPEKMWDKSKLYMGDEHYEYFIRGMEEHDKFISVVGHTATDDRKIWVSESGRTIRTDCGAGYKCYNCEGRLGAIRLNDKKEFYV